MTNIVHIPSTAPFLDSLVSAILEGSLPFQKGQAPKIEELANITLLLPTRRACRVCGEAFLRLSNSKAIILPTIRPLGDGDDDAGLIYEALSGGFTSSSPDQSLIDMKPAVSSLERHLILTQAILSWRKDPELAPEPHLMPHLEKEQVEGQIKPAQASLMAHELAKLIDNAETEEVDLSNLENLVPDQFSEHWQQTLDFLTIITKVWPNYLKATNQLSQASRRNLQLNKETERLEQTKPESPIIIAGSTGSVPAAARLMKAVANLENGLIVLPGLDQELDEMAFKNLVPNHPEHPQFGLSKLCADIGEPRSNVKAIEGTQASPGKAALTKFISEALRPSSSTEQWQEYIKQFEVSPEEKENLTAGFENISLNLARDAQEEAEMVSLILRRTAESKNQTAALVTPDRLLARRVAVRLEEWGIKVDDSGGRPLAKTMPGAFFDSIIQCQNSGFEPAFLLALLKHPLTRLGFERGDSRLAARALEISALRQPWMGRGLEGLRKTFETIRNQCCSDNNDEEEAKQTDVHLHPAIRRLKEEEWALAEQLLERLTSAFGPLSGLFKTSEDHNLQHFLDAHIHTAEHLAKSFEEREKTEIKETSDEEQGQAEEHEIGSQLWVGAAGEQLAKLCAEIISIKNVSPSLRARDYPEFYRSLIAGETVRPLTPVHPRIFIWGPFEARLQQTDVVILGGLNEGTWPNTANANPWLSRPMCQELGLPAPEQHIGYGAHDFASLLCAKEVYLTRAGKTDGVQTVPSRWIMRMSALLDGLKARDLLEPKLSEPFDQWAALRDKVEPAPKIKSPAPKPPVKARPRQLSVTRIEDWIANPYSIFARSILKLAPLDPLGAPPNAAMHGQIIHKAMQIFTERYPKSLPQNSEQELADISADLMKEIANHPQIGTFWQPRFERFTKWFAETEPVRRDELKQCHTELSGWLEIKAPAGPFILTARADRIDEAKDGNFHIYDYKTGTVPSPAKVKALFSPQLPLEAAIQQEAGFKGLNKGNVTALSYIAAKGGSPAGIETTIDGDQIGELIEQSLKQLENLVAKFDKEETPYKALRRHDFKGQYEYDDYAHLARVQEWGAEDESEDK